MSGKDVRKIIVFLRDSETRIGILKYLEKHSDSLTRDISASVGVPQSKTGYHLARMEEMSLVESYILSGRKRANITEEGRKILKKL